jgi:hypothetical protein
MSSRWGPLIAIAMSDSQFPIFEMPDSRFPVFEVVLERRGRKWNWRVHTSKGDVVMQGSESSRPAANYKADRALFLLLLSAPYRSI